MAHDTKHLPVEPILTLQQFFWGTVDLSLEVLLLLLLHHLLLLCAYCFFKLNISQAFFIKFIHIILVAMVSHVNLLIFMSLSKFPWISFEENVIENVMDHVL